MKPPHVAKFFSRRYWREWRKERTRLRNNARCDRGDHVEPVYNEDGSGYCLWCERDWRRPIKAEDRAIVRAALDVFDNPGGPF